MNGSCKVLFIDDEPDMHTLLRAVLDAPPPLMPKIELLEAMNFEGGLLILREQKPDVVLLDMNLSRSATPMVEMQTIAAMGERMAPFVPTIILTGHIDSASSEWSPGKLWKEARKAGALGWLRKDRYLDPRNREFLLHELADARIEFAVRNCNGGDAH